MLFLLKSKTPKMEKFFQDFAFKFYQIIFFYLKKLEISEVFVLLILALTLKSKTRKTQNIFQVLEISKQLICLRRMKISSFPSFQFWPLYWNWKLWKLGTWNKKFVFFEEVGNLQSFQVFSFSTYAEIENSKKLENFSRFAVFKKFVLFEEVKNFRYFWVFDFGPYIEIKNSQKIGNHFKTCKYQSRCFIWGSQKFLKFLNFLFWHLWWNWKLQNVGKFLKTYKFQIICFI